MFLKSVFFIDVYMYGVKHQGGGGGPNMKAKRMSCVNDLFWVQNSLWDHSLLIGSTELYKKYRGFSLDVIAVTAAILVY